MHRLRQGTRSLCACFLFYKMGIITGASRILELECYLSSRWGPLPSRLYECTPQSPGVSQSSLLHVHDAPSVSWAAHSNSGREAFPSSRTGALGGHSWPVVGSGLLGEESHWPRVLGAAFSLGNPLGQSWAAGRLLGGRSQWRKNHLLKILTLGTSLVVQWLGFRTSKAGVSGSIPGWGTEISHAMRCSQNFLKN